MPTGAHVGDDATMAEINDAASETGNTADQVIGLGHCHAGMSGRVVGVGSRAAGSEEQTAFAVELERRLLEMGFVEGAHIEVLHEGFIGRDPIAVRVDDMRVAIRRNEANSVMIRVAPSPPRQQKKTV